MNFQELIFNLMSFVLLAALVRFATKIIFGV